jgi:DNA-binding NarL/FixJ family response regulator
MALAAGWSVVPGETLQQLVGDRRRQGPVPDLGGADRLLWRRLAEGRSTAQLAAELHVSERTAKRMTAVLLRRLGVQTRMEAAALAGKEGLLGRPPG